MKLSRRETLAGSCALLGLPSALVARPSPVQPRTFDLEGPGGRSIQISEWRPQGRARALVLFSHGASSSPRFYERIFAGWLAAGIRVLAPLHVDSAEHPRNREFPGMASWKARIEDVQTLSAHVGAGPWVAAGHSYGALVALTLGGAGAVVPEGMTGPLADPAARAVVAFSPPAPIPALCTAEGYARLAVPALIQTGTADRPPGPSADTADAWRGHLVPYEAAAPGNDRYGLVLDAVDHYFGGAICRYDLPGPPQLERLADAVRLSALFIAARGLRDASARKSLDRQLGSGPPITLLHK